MKLQSPLDLGIRHKQAHDSEPPSRLAIDAICRVHLALRVRRAFAVQRASLARRAISPHAQSWSWRRSGCWPSISPVRSQNLLSRKINILGGACPDVKTVGL